MTFLYILLAICLMVFIGSLSAIAVNEASNDSRRLRKSKLNNESNRLLLNRICDLLEGYEVMSDEEHKELAIRIKEISDEHDHDIISDGWLTLALRSVEIPTCTPDISLNTNETLVYDSNSISLSRYQTESRTISGCGFRMSNQGFRVFGGNVRAINNESLKLIEGIGKLYVTNQRIIYITPEGKSYTIPMSRILDYAIEKDSIVIIVSNGKPYKFTTNDNLWRYDDLGIIIDSNFTIAKAIAQVKGN